MFVKHGRGIKVNDLYIDGAVKTYGFRPKKRLYNTIHRIKRYTKANVPEHLLDSSVGHI